jgi:LPPG:FO 2-phospho-L-lactate transferase
MEALGRYVAIKPLHSSAAPNWFNLGDKDLATHFYRTARLGEGALLDQITSEIASAWNLDIRLLPMTNDRVRTIVTLAEDCSAGPAGTEISFQEYFVQQRHSVSISHVRFDGAESAKPLGLEILRDAEVIIIAPSNPLVSIAPLRAIPGIDESLAKRRKSVVAISPIVAGAALKGPADRLMVELGHEASVVGVARLYSPICSTLVIDAADEHLSALVEAEGMRCVVTNTIMSTPEVSEQLARTVLECAL